MSRLMHCTACRRIFETEVKLRAYNVRCSGCKKRTKKNANAARLKREYNLSLAQFNILFSAQVGCCAICDTHQSTLGKALAVDHCHTTGKVRGLLCSNCNTAIGMLRDSIELLDKAKEYLKSTTVPVVVTDLKVV